MGGPFRQRSRSLGPQSAQWHGEWGHRPPDLEDLTLEPVDIGGVDTASPLEDLLRNELEIPSELDVDERVVVDD